MLFVWGVGGLVFFLVLVGKELFEVVVFSQVLWSSCGVGFLLCGFGECFFRRIGRRFRPVKTLRSRLL